MTVSTHFLILELYDTSTVMALHVRTFSSVSASPLENVTMTFSTPIVSSAITSNKIQHHLSGIKCKQEEPDKMEIDSFPPAKHVNSTSTPASNGSLVIPNIGFDVFDASIRPDPFIDFTLIEHANFLPGFDVCLTYIHWSHEDESIQPTDHIHERSGPSMFPQPLAVTGIADREQMFPNAPPMLHNLINDSQIAGSWHPLICMWLKHSMTGLLKYIQSKAPHLINPLAGTAKDCTTLLIHPEWSHHTIFIDPAQFICPTDSFNNWEASKTEVPNISSNFDTNTSVKEVAQRIFVFYFPLMHFGIIICNGGFLYRPTIHAYLTMLALMPIAAKHSQAAKSTKSKFQRLCITLFANFGLF
ncbi:hypothetical protein L218DRAFT_1008515 [Marasmius fiardii PR-910]|nr:hypothetical protein L218DRAFT_1008515 [Marasmius fiardii PR-910]